MFTHYRSSFWIGGADGCCSGTIAKANRSCSDHAAPCTIDASAATSPIVSHATVSKGMTKVLLVRKTGGTPVPVEVCGDPAVLGAVWPAGATGEVTRLRGSEGLDTSATNGMLTLAGRTLTGSLDGEWIGSRVATPLVSRQGHGSSICFDVTMAAFSAALVVVKPAQQVCPASGACSPCNGYPGSCDCMDCVGQGKPPKDMQFCEFMCGCRHC